MPANMIFNAAKFAFGLGCLVLWVVVLCKEPRRILCGLLLIWGLMFGISGGLMLWLPDTVDSGGGVALGEGSEILFGLFLLCVPLSLIIGILLCINGIKLMRRSASLAHALPILFGAVSIAWPLLLVVVLRTGALLFCMTLVWNWLLYLPMILAAFFLHSIIYALLPKRKSFGFVIVHGAGLRKDGTVTPLLRKRLDKARAIWTKAGATAKFIVSGGQGADEICTEAAAMRTYLLSCGVADDVIITEDKSRTTEENLRFSNAIIQANGGGRAAVVTSNYHVLRTVILTRRLGMDADGHGAKTAWSYLPAGFLREVIAVVFNYKALLALHILASTALIVLSRVL